MKFQQNFDFNYRNSLPSLMVNPGHAIKGGRFKVRVELVSHQMRDFGQLGQVRDAKNTRVLRELAATASQPDMEARNKRFAQLLPVVVQ